jgi:hypothetical protein
MAFGKRQWWGLVFIGALFAGKLVVDVLRAPGETPRGYIDAQKGVLLPDGDPRIALNAFDLPSGYKQYMPELKRGASGLIQTGACDSIDLGDLTAKPNKKDPAFFYYCKKNGQTSVVHRSLSEIRAGTLIFPNP